MAPYQVTVRKEDNIRYYTAAPQAKKIWVILALVQTNRVGTSAPQARNFVIYVRLCVIFLFRISKFSAARPQRYSNLLFLLLPQS